MQAPLHPHQIPSNMQSGEVIPPLAFPFFLILAVPQNAEKKKGGCQEWCLMICTAWCFSKGWNLSSLPISTSACMQDWFGYDPVQRTGGTPGGGL